MLWKLKCAPFDIENYALFKKKYVIENHQYGFVCKTLNVILCQAN